MKVSVEHDVTLSDAAVELLRGQLAMRRPKQPDVLPGERRGMPLSEASFKRTIRRLGASAYTTHGFRSAFRD